MVKNFYNGSTGSFGPHIFIPDIYVVEILQSNYYLKFHIFTHGGFCELDSGFSECEGDNLVNPLVSFYLCSEKIMKNRRQLWSFHMSMSVNFLHKHY